MARKEAFYSIFSHQQKFTNHKNKVTQLHMT
jgi:hypothetical protein